MRILQYVSSLSRSAGGLYFSVSGLSKALLTQGVDVQVIGKSDAGFAQDRHVWGDVPVHAFTARNKGYGLSSISHVLTEVRRFKPDVLHLHGIWSAGTVYARVAAICGVSVVVSPRGMLDPWILSRRRPMKAIHATLFEKPLLKTAYLHALNESERDSALRYMPSLGERMFVVPNGIPSVDALAPQQDRRGALYIGRLHQKKQVIELARAWRALPASAAHNLTIAGWGDAHYEAAINEVAANSSNVEFVGSLYGVEKIEALRKARYFILPSLSEGLPMAVLEALQYGCIPVITDQCNLPELFLHGVAARVEADFSDFGEIMSALLEAPNHELSRLSIAATVHADRYLWSKIAAKMLSHYEQIVQRRKTAFGASWSEIS